MQRFANRLLIEREDRMKADDFIERLKLAAVSSSPVDYIHLITGEGAPTEYIEEDEHELDRALEESETEPSEWDFTESQISADEAMAILAGIQGVTPMLTKLGVNGDDEEDEWAVIDLNENEIYGDGQDG